MDQLQLHLRLFKVLSSLSVTPNLSDYAWQLNCVILYDEYCFFLHDLHHSVCPNPLIPMIWFHRISWTLFYKKYIWTTIKILLCYTVQKVCPRHFSSWDRPFPNTQIVTEEQSSTKILNPRNSRESQPHFFSLDHEKWFFEVSISSRNTRITICNLVLDSKYENINKWQSRSCLARWEQEN